MLCCKTTLSILPQFGELCQNFSEVANFVTVYIEEVSWGGVFVIIVVVFAVFVVIFVIIVVVFVISVVGMIYSIMIDRPTQQKEVTSGWEGTVATMTSKLTLALRTGLKMAITVVITSNQLKYSHIKRLFKNYSSNAKAQCCRNSTRRGWQCPERVQNPCEFCKVVFNKILVSFVKLF